LFFNEKKKKKVKKKGNKDRFFVIDDEKNTSRYVHLYLSAFKNELKQGQNGMKKEKKSVMIHFKFND